MFFNKSLIELDADFLNAVGDHNFDKAKKLLLRGASISTQDAEGNTALHYLAAKAGETYIGGVDEFVCFLLNQNLEINARNKAGKTCLHFAAVNENNGDWGCTVPELIGVLINRGAGPNIADLEGRTPLHDVALRQKSTGELTAQELIKGGAHVNVRNDTGETPLHIAASLGKEYLVNLYLKTDLSPVAVQDKEGQYPHDWALQGGHHALSRKLLQKFEAYKPKKTPARTSGTKVPVKKTTAAKKDWVLMNPEQTAHVSLDKAIGYKLTEIFNFRARTYTQITHNLETKAEAVVTKGFDEFADKAMFVEAHRELTRLGGRAAESTIHGRTLDKIELKPSH